MTREEFEQAYAQRSGVTVEWLHEHDRRAYPCDCGEEGCEGWQMLSREHAIDRAELGDFDPELIPLMERYANDPQFRVEADMAMGVHHIPLHPPGDCQLCDRQHAKRDLELIAHVRLCVNAGCKHPIVYPTGDSHGYTLGWCGLCRTASDDAATL